MIKKISKAQEKNSTEKYYFIQSNIVYINSSLFSLKVDTNIFFNFIRDLKIIYCTYNGNLSDIDVYKRGYLWGGKSLQMVLKYSSGTTH